MVQNVSFVYRSDYSIFPYLGAWRYTHTQNWVLGFQCLFFYVNSEKRMGKMKTDRNFFFPALGVCSNTWHLNIVWPCFDLIHGVYVTILAVEALKFLEHESGSWFFHFLVLAFVVRNQISWMQPGPVLAEAVAWDSNFVMCQQASWPAVTSAMFPWGNWSR